MAAFVNDRYVRLINTVPRYVAAIGGLKSATILIFKRTATGSAPAVPSVSATFDYSTGVLSGLNNGWSTNLPPVSDGAYLWGTLFYASASTGTVAVPSASWPAAQLMSDAAPAVAAQADATAALNNAALSTAAIDAMVRDDILSPSEKPAENAMWGAIVNEFTAIYNRGNTLGLATQRDAYGAAYSSLSTYITGLGAQFSTIPGVNLSIVGTTYRSMFQAYRDARQTLLDKIYEITATKAVWANGITGRPADAELLNSYIVVGGRNLYPDSGFERAKHPCSSRVNVGTLDFTNGYGATAYSGTRALFFDTQNLTGQIDFYVYLGGDLCSVKPGKQYVFSFMYASSGPNISGNSTYFRLSNTSHVAVPIPVLNTGGVWTLCEFLWTCPEGITTVEARFGLIGAYYSWMAVDCIQMEEGNKRTQWHPAPEDFIAEIDAIANDNILSKGEKAQVRLDWAAIDAERNPLLNQAAALGVGSNPYNARYLELLNYLVGIGPNSEWADPNVDSVINGTNFRNAFTNYYTAKGDLQNAISSKAAIASSTINLVGRNCTVIGNSITKTSGAGGAWDADAYSKESFANGAYCSFTVPVVGYDLMAGLNSDPLADSVYTSLDFAIYLTGSQVRVYLSGLPVGGGSGTVYANYGSGDRFTVKYDGTDIIFEKNGIEFYRVRTAVTVPLFFDCSIVQIGVQIANIVIGALSSNYNSAGKGSALNSDPACAHPSEWNISNGPAAVNFTAVTDGKSGTSVIRSIPGNSFQCGGESKFFPMTAGRTYRISSWIRASQSGKVSYLRVRRWNSTGGLIEEASGYEGQPSPTAWTRWTNTVVAEPGTTTGQLTFYLSWNNTSAGYVEIQDFRVEDVTEVVAAQAEATAATTALTAIFADNILSRDEKTDLVQRYNAIAAELDPIRVQADNLLVSRAAYDAAFQTLYNYIVGLSPGWSDTTQNTTIVRADANAAWNGYYTAKVNLLNSISQKAAQSILTVDLGDGTHFGARNRNDPPIDYPVGTTRQFKQRSALLSTDGLAASHTSFYGTLETIKQFSDGSGGGVYQYFYVDGATFRRWSPNAAMNAALAKDNWFAWVQDLDRNVFTGDLDSTKGAPAGTQVGGSPATTVEANAANGNAAATALNNPPVVTLGNAFSTGGTGVRTFTVSSTVTGGTAPYTYAWSFIPWMDEPGLSLYSGADTATATMRSINKTAGTSSSGMLTLNVRDAKGLTGSKSTFAEAEY